MSVYVDGRHVQEAAFTTHTHTHTHAHTRPLTDEDNSHNKTRMQTPLFFIHAINTPTFEHNTSIHTIHAAKKWSFKCSGTRTVQADSDSDSDSESRRRSASRLPAGWDRTVEADYRR